jgi:Ca-activated chloride channel homolog
MIRVVLYVSLAVAVVLEAESGPARVHWEPAAPRPAVSSATLKAGTNLVLVPVTVLDSKSAPVIGLPRSMFRIYEDGVEQQLSSFSQEEAPASIGIVFDASRSMRPKLPAARQAVLQLLDQALPGDEYQLVSFNDSARALTDLTMNREVLGGALGQINPQGWTALFDGVMLSAHSLRNAGNVRRALIVVSDGEDNFSRYTSDEVRSYLLEAGVVIYSIGLSVGGFAKLQTRYLRKLSEATGGWCFPVSNAGNLPDTIRAIGSAIRGQYVLAFSSNNPRMDGKYRRIRVEMSPVGRLMGSSLSWRAGYYAPDGVR